MRKILQILNGIAFISMIVVNYLSNTGLMNNTTIGEVSGSIKSMFTPAGYAFSIWGIIYILLFGFVIFQGRGLFSKRYKDDFILSISWWFVISCVANIVWIFSWIYGYTGISCICIFLLLFALLQIVIKNDMELWDAPIGIIVFLWWPFVIYCGWITVASIANVSSYLVKIDWNGFGISDTNWTIIMIVIATSINLLVTWIRNMREFAVVGAWALISIAVANNELSNPVFFTSLTAASILLVSSGVHGFINRKTNPLIKFRDYLDHRF